jgi:hypothetical protein
VSRAVAARLFLAEKRSDVCKQVLLTLLADHPPPSVAFDDGRRIPIHKPDNPISAIGGSCRARKYSAVSAGHAAQTYAEVEIDLVSPSPEAMLSQKYSESPYSIIVIMTSVALTIRNLSF